MEIIFKNKKMIVTHPSGVISEYTADNLQARKDRINIHISKVNEEFSILDSQIASINASTAD